MKCVWCQNPESQKKENQILFQPNSCQGFGDCIAACPTHAISKNKNNKIDYDKCNSCGVCINVCPTGSLSLIGKDYSSKEIFEEIIKDIPYYKNNGGVTFSGGEASTQIEFLEEVLNLCKAHDIHTNIETNGLFSFEKLENIFRKLDMIYFDLKLFHPESHKKFTGVDNKIILNNARNFSKKKFPILFRIPLIQNITDTDVNLQDFICFLKGLNVSKISLLKYHNFYENKLDGIGRTSEKLNLPPYPEEKFIEIKKLFKKNQIQVV